MPHKILLSTSLSWSRWAFPTSGRTDWKCQRSPFVLSNTILAHVASWIYIFHSNGMLIHCFHPLQRADESAVLLPEGHSNSPSPSHWCICILELLSDNGACGCPCKERAPSAARGAALHTDVADVLQALHGLCFFHLLRQGTGKAGYLSLLSKCILQAVWKLTFQAVRFARQITMSLTRTLLF